MLDTQAPKQIRALYSFNKHILKFKTIKYMNKREGKEEHPEDRKGSYQITLIAFSLQQAFFNSNSARGNSSTAQNKHTIRTILNIMIYNNIQNRKVAYVNKQTLNS